MGVILEEAEIIQQHTAIPYELMKMINNLHYNTTNMRRYGDTIRVDLNRLRWNCWENYIQWSHNSKFIESKQPLKTWSQMKTSPTRQDSVDALNLFINLQNLTYCLMIQKLWSCHLTESSIIHCSTGSIHVKASRKIKIKMMLNVFESFYFLQLIYQYTGSSK